ncbi:sugar phosphate nucleotidyltransferase [Vibrio cholerae]|uniref:sugar phosphate nucleotidyltransferase n=1 Tax=Vibrio cholerae TaxID=666 RepID=UPI001EB0D5BB|nr:sugar phosphate nucleotidyltransferase [Vibrio cholerae]EGQ7944304.1 CBS domain-containing protein [Vibrio cholerae]MDV2397112.1 sugar phosphate nucleotidyltransferase [Vibrio cholerae]
MQIKNDNPLVYSSDLTIDDVVKHMSKSGYGYVALVNSEHRLVGILTDSDIRRAFMKKEYDLEKVINRKPKVLHVDSSEQKVINLLKKMRRRHMPLVGSCGTYKGVFCLDDIDFNTKDNWVVIMAGGLGSRMGELTKHTPKPMLNVAGKPVLEHIIDNFVSKGFFNFLISVNYKKEVIKDYFQDGFSRGINIRYVEETIRMGTAGALSLIDFDIDKPVLVTNGDVLTHLNYDSLLDWHCANDSVATMCVREHTSQIQFGVVEFDSNNNIVDFREKPEIKSHVNAGVYVLSPVALKYVKKDVLFDMPELFERLRHEGLLPKVYNVKDYWIDIGLREQFEQANKDYQN